MSPMDSEPAFWNGHQWVAPIINLDVHFPVGRKVTRQR